MIPGAAKSCAINLGTGNLHHGFPSVTAQLWTAGNERPEQFIGSLPAAPALIELYRNWQSIYQNLCARKQLLSRSQEEDDELEIDSGGITNVSVVDFEQVCQKLEEGINAWLNSESFFKLERQMRSRLSPDEEIRVIIETNDGLLRRLPWHRWDFFNDYPYAEVALSQPEYKRQESYQPVTRKQVRILAILGNSSGIDLETETKFLHSLSDAEVVFCVNPSRQELNAQLWDKIGWDILFFAGHSQTEGETGRIYINESKTNNSLTIEQLEEALKSAIAKGLQLAIFNSCDGLGLAIALEKLSIPTVIVMREPVPNRVAQDFFKYFLDAFAFDRLSLYLSVQIARRQLQGLEEQFPGASWLPVICQNPAVESPTWLSLGGIPPCPYRGLFAFQEQDAHLFFGREQFTEELVKAAKTKPLVAVVGSSGSGKSSVVFAGLIPSLRKAESAAINHYQLPRDRHSVWEQNYPSPTIVSFRPGNNPIEALAAAIVPLWQHLQHESEQKTIRVSNYAIASKSESLNTLTATRLLPAYDEITKIESMPLHLNKQLEQAKEKLAENDRLAELELGKLLQQDDRGLGKIIESFVQQYPGKRVVLIADQFEEIYTLCPESERQPFLDKLLNAVKLAPAFTLVLTLRADFYGHALSYRPFSDALQGTIHNLGPMSREELQSAIEQPATLMQVKLEEGLIDKLINATWGHPGRLPLLEFALTQLWSKQQQGWLTNQAYEEIGGVEEALANHAEAVYAQLNEADRIRAQRVFIQLVQPGGIDANRRLATKDEVKPENWDLVTRLASARLVVTNSNSADEETVEIVHEALIRSWGRLGYWMQVDGEFRLWQEQLRAAIRQWENSSFDEGALLRGKPLADAEHWHQQRFDELSETEQDFIGQSLALKDREIKKQKRRRQLTISSLMGGLAVTSMLALVALWQWQNSDIRALTQSSEAHFSKDEKLDALIEALKAGKKLEKAIAVDSRTRIEAVNALQQAVYWVRERNRLQGHKDEVNSVSISQDGKIIASASDDKTIKLWNFEGKELRTLKGHTAPVNSISISSEGIIASASSDRTLKLWNFAGKIIKTLTGHQATINSVSISPDGKTIASASKDKTIKLWRIDGREIKTLPQNAAVLSVAWSRNGKMLAAAKIDGAIALWNLETNKILTLKGHREEANSVSFSPDGKMLASTGYDKTIRLWRVADGKQIWAQKGHSDSVWTVSFSPDGKTIASASIDKTIKVWNLDGKLLKTFLQNSWLKSIAFTPNGKTIAAASIDGTVKLWTVEGNDLLTLSGHNDVVRSANFSPDSKTIATGSDDTTIKLWSRDGRLLNTLKGHSNKVYSVAWSPDGKMLASGSDDNSIKLWKIADGKLILTLKHKGAVRSLAWSPDGKSLASGSDDNTIKLWRIADSKELLTLKGHKDAIYSIAWSPDGQIIASGSFDNTIKLWRFDGKLLNTLKGHSNSVRSVAWSPDGKILASASTDNTIKLWSREGKQLLTMNGNHGWVYSVAWSLDGQIIAAANDDNSIQLWSVDGKNLGLLIGHSDKVRSVAWSYDGKMLVSASSDRQAFLWNLALLDFDVLLQHACDRARDYLNTNPHVSNSNRHLCDAK